MGTPNTSVIVLMFVFMQLGFELGCSSVIGGGHYPNVSCIDSEQKALVKFKQSLVDKSNRLSSWAGDDCCTWHGVGCSKRTGRVVRLDLRNPSFHLHDWLNDVEGHQKNYLRNSLGGEINPSLLNLTHLHFLDLSFNNFDGIQIPEFLGSLKNLRYLNLFFSSFNGKIPHHLGNLSSLQYLNLSNIVIATSYNLGHTLYYNYELTIDSLWWVSRLASLKHLDLNGVKLENAIDLFHPINMLPSLVVLNLAGCEIQSISPLSFVNFTSLVSLTLEANNIKSTFPLWFSNISGLQHLHLGYNYFYGSIPNSALGRLTSLTFLNLRWNSFNVSFPNSLCNLTSLVQMSLSTNEFQGSIPTEIGNLTQLTNLDLSINMFNGYMPASLGRLSSLRELYISDNQLSGSIPPSIGQLLWLENLDVSRNSLAGTVSEHHFARLTRLDELYLSSNSLAFSVSSQWIPPFQLRLIDIGSCKLGPQFPPWLQTQRHVEFLTINNASISDTIPDWFENLYSRISYLDLSYNQISGKMPQFLESNAITIPNMVQRSLLLNNNKFEGPLTMFPANSVNLDASNNLLSGHMPLIIDNMTLELSFLSLSNNRLSGGVPAYLCNIKNLATVDLSKNQFSGRLPSCLGDLKSLWRLDVTNNSLHGHIPSSLGSLRILESLHLHNNRFHGKLPLSLQNLTDLVILDLGGNAFTDILPSWIGEKLLNLKFLSLQSNNFYGDIPLQFCYLNDLQLLNLAHNNISGNIPPCFQNFTGVAENHTNDKYTSHIALGEKLMDSMKGRELEFTKTLRLVTSIDLSNNSLVGQIPQELMDLVWLRNLNLAGNHLHGRMPENIGNLKQLESLDLSRNELSGPIPQTLSDLNFLSHLNLSFNNLSGRIPRGNQLQTLDDPSIYMGNNEICGVPLLKSCPGDAEYTGGHEHVGESERGNDSNGLWFYAGIGPGFLVGFLGVCGVLHFKKSWRYAYFQFIDNVYNRLVVAIAVNTTWLRRKFYKGETA